MSDGRKSTSSEGKKSYNLTEECQVERKVQKQRETNKKKYEEILTKNRYFDFQLLPAKCTKGLREEAKR